MQSALDFRQEHIPFVTERKHKLRTTEHPSVWIEPVTTAIELRAKEGNRCIVAGEG
jgi:hypothetical protein